MLGERGTFFGYSDLVVDPRNLLWMQVLPSQLFGGLSQFMIHLFGGISQFLIHGVSPPSISAHLCLKPTLHPKSSTRNPNPKTRNPKLRIRNPNPPSISKRIATGLCNAGLVLLFTGQRDRRWARSPNEFLEVYRTHRLSIDVSQR